jgi:hypothetical protein
MVIEGHRQGLRGDHKKMSKQEIDKDLKETREGIKKLMLQWQRM